MKPTILSIGTTHPRNSAGVGRDLVVGTEQGCDVVTAVAAVSVQDDGGVRALHVLPAALVRAQLAALASCRIDGVRIGALGSPENVTAVAEYLENAATLAVVDPVARASSGELLVEDGAFDVVRDRLATFGNVLLTPNLPEAAMLLGRARIERDEMEEAAQALQARGALAVLLKGGHAPGEPVDVLATRERTERFEGARIGAEMRGTGCTLAMALCCALARGATLRDAVLAARAYLREKMTAFAAGE